MFVAINCSYIVVKGLSEDDVLGNALMYVKVAQGFVIIAL